MWDLRRGEQVQYMTPDGEGYLKGEVTALLLVGGGKTLAVGYSNGMVRCYDAARGGSPLVSLMGHKGAVGCLAGDADASGLAAGKGGAMLLCSGGNDTDVVVWDLVAERGLCRLKGHRDAVTSVRFIPRPPSAVAASFLGSGGGGSAALGLAGGGGLGSGGRGRLLCSASKDAVVKVGHSLQE